MHGSSVKSLNGFKVHVWHVALSDRWLPRSFLCQKFPARNVITFSVTFSNFMLVLNFDKFYIPRKSLLRTGIQIPRIYLNLGYMKKILIHDDYTPRVTSLNTCNRLTPRSCMQQLSLICHCTVHGRTLACEPKTVLPTLSLSCVRIAQDIVECCSFLHHVRRVNWHPTVNGYWALFVQLPIYCSLKWFIVTQCGSVSRSMYWRRFSPDVSSTFGCGAKFCPYFITDNDLLNRPIMP